MACEGVRRLGVVLEAVVIVCVAVERPLRLSDMVLDLVISFLLSSYPIILSSQSYVVA